MSDNQQLVTRMRIVRGAMIQTSEMRQETDYTISNDDVTPRWVLIDHPWRAAGSSRTAHSNPSKPRERFIDCAKASTQEIARFAVVESSPVETRYDLTNLTNDQVAFFVQQKSINPEVEAALRRILERKNQLAALDQQISEKDDENSKIYDDQ